MEYYNNSPNTGDDETNHAKLASEMMSLLYISNNKQDALDRIRQWSGGGYPDFPGSDLRLLSDQVGDRDVSDNLQIDQAEFANGEIVGLCAAAKAFNIRAEEIVEYIYTELGLRASKDDDDLSDIILDESYLARNVGIVPKEYEELINRFEAWRDRSEASLSFDKGFSFVWSMASKFAIEKLEQIEGYIAPDDHLDADGIPHPKFPFGDEDLDPGP